MILGEKYTIKNHPNADRGDWNPWEFVEATQEWVKKFKQQEVEIIGKMDKKIEECKNPFVARYLQGYRDAIEEILGVES